MPVRVPTCIHMHNNEALDHKQNGVTENLKLIYLQNENVLDKYKVAHDL